MAVETALGAAAGLLQHAHNPVDWYPWGQEAFAKARAEDKPILLSVRYATCHWCHVMERESFEDVAIARQLPEGFVRDQGSTARTLLTPTERMIARPIQALYAGVAKRVGRRWVGSVPPD